MGPVEGDGKWFFQCPVHDVPADVDGAAEPRTCTAEWLQGQLLRGVGDKKLGERTCYCFETDPYEGEPNVEDSQRRYFLYRFAALQLGGAGRRVDLPKCVRTKINAQFGDSQVGFKDPNFATSQRD